MMSAHRDVSTANDEDSLANPGGSFVSPESGEQTRTEHYTVPNIAEFKEHADTIHRYLSDVERGFPVIEEVFGAVWQSGTIVVTLVDAVGCSYGKSDGCHKVLVGLADDVIQKKGFPENLWGCLFHETLHAFANPVIHKRRGGANCLDEYYCDNDEGEPFILAFQRLVYLRMKEKAMISFGLLRDFENRLRRALKPGALRLYERYVKMFSAEADGFQRFVHLLDSCETPMFRKKAFWEDLSRAEEMLALGCGTGAGHAQSLRYQNRD